MWMTSLGEMNALQLKAGEILPCEVGAMTNSDKRGREDTTAAK